MSYHTVYHLYEDESKKMLTDILEVQFVELPKFIEESPGINNTLNRWLTFLTNPQEGLKEGMEMAEPAIKKAITVLDMLSRDPETVRLAELKMKHILDEKSMLEGAKEEGKEEGREEGFEKGKLEVAMNLLDVLDIETIALKTGLPVEQIKKLKQ